MDYELIALDLDDTVLGPDKKISDRNRSAVRAALAAGVRVIIASGRAYLGVRRFRDELGLRDYTISTGGSVTMDPDGRVFDTDPIDPETTHGVMQWAMERGIYFQVYTGEGFMYRKRTAHTDRYEYNNGFRGILTKDLPERQDIAAGKILFIDSAENISRWGRELAEVYPSLLIQTSHPTFLEISSRAASKGAALERLARHLGVPREKVMAIGDSEIDRSMIEWAGLGVAMENAAADIRAEADWVTGPSSQDGVADAIERFVLASSPAAGTGAQQVL